jgi:hypothetical protein
MRAIVPNIAAGLGSLVRCGLRVSSLNTEGQSENQYGAGFRDGRLFSMFLFCNGLQET